MDWHKIEKVSGMRGQRLINRLEHSTGILKHESHQLYVNIEFLPHKERAVTIILRNYQSAIAVRGKKSPFILNSNLIFAFLLLPILHL
jgi:hypothetical protein